MFTSDAVVPNISFETPVVEIPLTLILAVPDGVSVDHIDADGLNCRRSNLRTATPAQNAWNRRDNRVSMHGFRGVHGRGNRFYGRVMADGRDHNTKSFPCPILAAAARDVLAQRLHGEYAVLNFQFVPLEAQ